MIKGLMITPPVIGRIAIGKVVERNGKRLPEKDDEFTITTQVQSRGQWILHPLDETLRLARAVCRPRWKSISMWWVRTVPRSSMTW